MNHETNSGSTIGSLLTDLRDATTSLLQQEVALAKAELSEKAKIAAKNAMEIAAGGAVAYAGLIVLLIGLGQLAAIGLIAMGVGTGVAAWLGLVVVGLIVAVIGWVMLAKAKRALRTEDLVPTQTLDSLQENKRWAQNKIHSTNEPAT